MTHRASLVLRLTDGFRGQPVASAAAVRFWLNGQAVKPLYKPGGWFVLIDLPPGEYTVRVDGPGFCPLEWTAVLPDGTGFLEYYRELNPAEEYPFGGAAVRFYGTVLVSGTPAAGREALLIQPGRGQIKLAEDGVEAGRERLRLFLSSRNLMQAVPGEFFLPDGKSSETVMLMEERDGLFLLAAPLRAAHKRGTALYPVRRYQTGADGRFFAALMGTAQAELYLEADGTYRRFAVDAASGEQTFAL